MSNCECYAVIDSDNERVEIWRKVCPDLRVPLKHPGLCKGTAAGEEIFMYEGDPDRMSGFQRARLAELFAEKFKISEMLAFEELKKGHLPVRAENVTVVICQLHSKSTIYTNLTLLFPESDEKLVYYTIPLDSDDLLRDELYEDEVE